MHIIFDTDELVFQWPLPSDGLQRLRSGLYDSEWVCFAPGYPAWEVMV